MKKEFSKHSRYFLCINTLCISNVNSARALSLRPQEFTQVRQIMLPVISVVTDSCLSFIPCQWLDFMCRGEKEPQMLKLTSCGETSNPGLSWGECRRR